MSYLSVTAFGQESPLSSPIESSTGTAIDSYTIYPIETSKVCTVYRVVCGINPWNDISNNMSSSLTAVDRWLNLCKLYARCDDTGSYVVTGTPAFSEDFTGSISIDAHNIPTISGYPDPDTTVFLCSDVYVGWVDWLVANPPFTVGQISFNASNPTTKTGHSVTIFSEQVGTSDASRILSSLIPISARFAEILDHFTLSDTVSSWTGITDFDILMGHNVDNVVIETVNEFVFPTIDLTTRGFDTSIIGNTSYEPFMLLGPFDGSFVEGAAFFEEFYWFYQRLGIHALVGWEMCSTQMSRCIVNYTKVNARHHYSTSLPYFTAWLRCYGYYGEGGHLITTPSKMNVVLLTTGTLEPEQVVGLEADGITVALTLPDAPVMVRWGLDIDGNPLNIDLNIAVIGSTPTEWAARYGITF